MRRTGPDPRARALPRAPVDSRTVSTTPSGRGSDRHVNARGIPTRALPFLVGALLAILAVAPVSAHAELEVSDPADGATLTTPPTQVVLGFSEELADKSKFKLLGPDGATVANGTVGQDATTLSATGLSLGPGLYTVEWTSVAPDGDVLRGKLTFTVAEPTPPPATPTPAPTAAPTEAASVAPSEAPSVAVTPAPTPAPSADTTPASSSGTDVLIPIVAGLALVAVVGAIFLRRNRGAA